MSAPQRYRAGAYGAMVADDKGPWVHANAWQPIESAPKDGTPVLLFSGTGGRLRVCWWDRYHWVFHQKYGGPAYVVLEPTHWMPLPEPPR